ncbi:MAG: bifunctional rhamnulose-1-phosphate aldolase/short-chain dehydrogenase [Bryobacteraceae bacterium]
MKLKQMLIPDHWDSPQARFAPSDDLDALRYRSNLLGSDLRITNFGGGNTSSKYEAIDPFTGKPTRVLAVKGSGGDLGSIRREGFAQLYMDKLEQLQAVYRGEAHEDDMVAFYPSCAFANNTVPASIDTPLHAFLPYAHVDHLHPDWAIALAAIANGRSKLAEFNKRYGRKLVWLPWQRPGFELGLMLRRAVEETPDCDGIILASHGLFTWGDTQQSCYESSLAVINELGEFVLEHQERKGSALFGGAKWEQRSDAAELAIEILPYLRGRLATHRRSIAHISADAEAARFCNATWAADLGALGTSCPDHFIRTRIAPLYVNWNPTTGTGEQLQEAINGELTTYRERYTAYYNANKEQGSPALRDPNPSVVLIPGVGMFSFGRSKKEARITGEFYGNAIRVMAGATGMEDDVADSGPLPQAKDPARAGEFASFHNYVSLPPREAFRIEYWALEEAKLQRMPKEKDFARRIFLVVGGASGVGRAAALQLAGLEAHVMVADRNGDAAVEVAKECGRIAGADAVAGCAADLTSRGSIAAAIAATIGRFGGIDGMINTAAMAPGPLGPGMKPEDQWRVMLDVNVTSNFVLVDELRPIFKKQELPASVVLTSSANAVVPKSGTESYDTSKAAVNHLIRQLAMGLAPLVRVNGVAPATVVAGSQMFPRDRVIMSLHKYNLPCDESESTETLRDRLAAFYATRTLTGRVIRPEDCAEALVWLASDKSSRTTGHVLPVDGGLPEAFLR